MDEITSSIEELRKIFNVCEDLEFKVYTEQLKKLLGPGLKLKWEFKNQEYFQWNNSTIDWADTTLDGLIRSRLTNYIGEQDKFAMKVLHNRNRKYFNGLIIFEDEEYELELTPDFKLTGKITHPQLLFQDGGYKVFNAQATTGKHKISGFLHVPTNIIYTHLRNLPPEILEILLSKPALQISVRLLHKSILRQDFENSTLILAPRTFLNTLLDVETFKQKLKTLEERHITKERLKLWGYYLSHTLSLTELIPYIDRISYTDFDIKNVLHLQWLVSHFDKRDMTNQELLDIPSSIKNYEKCLKEFTTQLQLGLPLDKSIVKKD